jgi:hypothetical protein
MKKKLSKCLLLQAKSIFQRLHISTLQSPHFFAITYASQIAQAAIRTPFFAGDERED